MGTKFVRQWRIIAMGAVFLLLAGPVFAAINTRTIEIVRNKSVLGREDFAIIDGFVGQAIQDLLEIDDFSSVAEIRRAILTRSSSNKPSAQAQYSEHFFESAYNRLNAALQKASGLAPPGRKFKVTVNLLILLDGLLVDCPERTRLADLAVRMLKNKNMVIRYWAVHCLTNAGIRKQLNSPHNPELAGRIVKELEQIVSSSDLEIIRLMTDFAAALIAPQANELLLQIADMRIKKYESWKVKYELLDASVLKALYKKISTGLPNKTEIARRFGQLYSYTMQRYIKDTSGAAVMTDASRDQLISVLVEVEKKCIGPLVGTRQMSIKRAIESNNITKLLQEHNRLLGDKTKAGVLPKKLGYNYKGPFGSERTGPLVLPEPPKRTASKKNKD